MTSSPAPKQRSKTRCAPGVVLVTSVEEYGRLIENHEGGVGLWVMREDLRHAITRDHAWEPDCQPCMGLAASDVNQPDPDR